MEIDEKRIFQYTFYSVFVFFYCIDRCIVAFLYESVTNTINYTYLGSYILKLNRTFTCLPFFAISISVSLSPFFRLAPQHNLSLSHCYSALVEFIHHFAVWFVVLLSESGWIPQHNALGKSADQKDDEFLKAPQNKNWIPFDVNVTRKRKKNDTHTTKWIRS